MENMRVVSNNPDNDWIKFVPFRDITFWDVKRYSSERISSEFPIVKLGLHIKEESHKVKLYDFPEEEFGILGVNNKIGIFDAYKEKGAKINQAYKRMEVGWIAYNPYRVNVGSIGMRTEEHKHEFISPAYVVFSCKESLLPDFLFKLFKTERFNKIIKESTTGSVRQNLTFDVLETMNIALPNTKEQSSILQDYYKKIVEAEKQEMEAELLVASIEEYLFKEVAISINESNNPAKGLNFMRYQDIIEWGINKINVIGNNKSEKYQNINLQKRKDLLIDINRGKSPIYDKSSDVRILNQKCIKWNEIELEHSKSVDKDWLGKIGKKFLSQQGDILINSTGEGTMGRSSLVTDGFENLFYDSHILCLRLNPNAINPLFWVYMFNSKYGQQQVESLKTAQSTNQTELGVNNVLKIQIPLPDISIQNNIVKEIYRIKGEANSLKESAELNRKEAIKEFELAIFNS